MDGGYSDLIYGNSGNDWIHGRAGNDWISGGTGRDVLRGGAGDDLFDVDKGDSVPGGSAADVIKGFDGVGRAVGDVIDLSDLSSATLIFRGTGAFTGINQVRVHDVGTSTVVDVNLSGTAAPETQIVIEDLASLASAYRGADFIL
jgi:Ca2+-binding RTX toxin-like protein